jgi:hypothetical protein
MCMASVWGGIDATLKQQLPLLPRSEQKVPRVRCEGWTPSHTDDSFLRGSPYSTPLDGASLGVCVAYYLQMEGGAERRRAMQSDAEQDRGGELG